MSERLSIELEPISGRKPHIIEIKEEQPIMGQGLEPKVKVRAETSFGKKRLFRKRKRKEVNFVERKLNSLDSDDYIAKWKQFSEAGLPVVSTLRKSSRDSLFQTDLKSDGTELYGKAFWYLIYSKSEFRLRPVDKIFLNLTDTNNFQKIAEKVFMYKDLADKNGILLPYDDPFELIVHPDGKWDFVIIDLRFGEKLEAGSGESRRNEIVEKNSRFVGNFLDQLKYIRVALLEKI